MNIAREKIFGDRAQETVNRPLTGALRRLDEDREQVVPGARLTTPAKKFRITLRCARGEEG